MNRNILFFNHHIIKIVLLPVIIALFLTNGIATADNNTLTDIEYCKPDGFPQLLDIGTPDGEGPFPTVILVHGGGWCSGEKEHMSFMYKPLTDAGIAWVSISYRLAPQHKWPACIDDVNTAIKWVCDNGSKYKLDTDKLAITGYSAGGHLAVLAAVQAGKDNPFKAVIGIAAPTDFVADIHRRGQLSPSLQNLFGLPSDINYDLNTLLIETSPINYLRPQLPPFLLMHGTKDRSVPYDQSTHLRDRLVKMGVECKMISVLNGEHNIGQWYRYDMRYMQDAISWIKEKLLDKNSKPEKEFPADTKIITVNKDGSGDFAFIQYAVNSIKPDNKIPTAIRIAPGIYSEQVIVPADKPHISFIGESARDTIITGGLYAKVNDEQGNEIGTFKTATVFIFADDFTAENITFENSAGRVGQALAISVSGQRCIFNKCRFLGNQDTILTRDGRQLYKDCYITGTTDFIFGGAIAYFDNCHIHCLKNSYITAASTPQENKYGYVFNNCTITGERDKVTMYFGRPWRDYANVIFLNTKLEVMMKPEGWHNWSKPHREKTAFYAEYNSYGPNSDTSKRVRWSHQLTKEQAEEITIENVLGKPDNWKP